MVEITECKKRVREMLRDFGYKKIAMSEHKFEMSKVYFTYKGVIHIHVNEKLSFHFGEDKIMGCSAHICADGTDCGTHHKIAEEIFKKMLTGNSSPNEVCDYICSL